MKLRKTDFYILLLLLFPILAIVDNSFLGYYDELIGLTGSTYALILKFRHKLSKFERVMVNCLTILTIMGLISNIIFKIQSNYFAMAVDIVFLWKMYGAFILFRHLFKQGSQVQYATNRLSLLAKITILLTLCAGILQQFVDIGCGATTVSGTIISYFGIKQFGLFGGNGIQTGWLMMICLLILSASNISRREYFKYIAIASVALLLTFSSLVYGFLFTFVYLTWLLSEKTVFKIRYIVFLAIGILLFTVSDIAAYSTSTAPRMILIRNGVDLANHHFPLGTGFATYGTEMSKRYYSPIYINLGWENTWGFGREGRYLNDNFFAYIIGQFGWIGISLYAYILYNFYKLFNTTTFEKRHRVIMVTICITIGIVMIASGAAKTMMGVAVFSFMGMFSSIENGMMNCHMISELQCVGEGKSESKK